MLCSFGTSTEASAPVVLSFFIAQFIIEIGVFKYHSVFGTLIDYNVINA